MKLRNHLSFVSGLFAGIVSLSIAFASVERPSSDDILLYDEISDVNVKKQKAINFDHDIEALAQMEKRFVEELPLDRKSRLKRPMQRIEKRKYRASRRK